MYFLIPTNPCELEFLILSAYSDTQQRSTSSGDWLIISVDAPVVINLLQVTHMSKEEPIKNKKYKKTREVHSDGFYLITKSQIGQNICLTKHK